MALPREHLLDELATAYVQAIAAAAGAIISLGRDYGVDGTLKQIVKSDADGYMETGAPVDFQLKGTTRVDNSHDIIKFDLSARNYNLIIGRRPAATPYYLFLVCFDSTPENWLLLERERLILNASAFWWTRAGVRTANKVSVRIEIPTANRLTPATISDMLQASHERFADD
jgi:hypothetical protein